MNGLGSSTIPPQVSQLGNVPPPGRRFGLTETCTGHSQTARAADGIYEAILVGGER